ncbi:MAG: ribosome assembly cofactor RimP, partial [Bacteroidota bacterium]|nr:ribosome assembly cofactor RimP [Bacteroidota bacterium]
MITKQYIKSVVEEIIGKFNKAFIVDISVNTSNNIKILVDSYEGFSISDCVELSRFVEGKLDRDKDDFALEVASAGLSEAFKVIEQYKKNIGNEVEVITKEGEKYSAVLLAISDDGVELEHEKMVKKEGKK